MMVMKKTFPIHPLLFALYPVLFLYTEHPSDVPAGVCERMIVLSLGGALFLMVILRWVFKDWMRSAVVSSAAIVTFYLFGHLYLFFYHHQMSPLSATTLRLVVVGVAIAGLTATAIVTAHNRTSFPRLTLGLNICAVLLLLLPGERTVRLAFFGPARVTVHEFHANAGIGVKGKPDIAYIILDGFARRDVFKKYFDYDDAWFLDSLRQMGFSVRDDSRANYGQTLMSLAATLNGSYLEDLVPEEERRREDRRVLPQLIQDNAVFQFLHGQGYRVICISSGYAGTEVKKFDSYLAPFLGMNEVEQVFLQGTIAAPFLDLVWPQWQYALQRNRVLFALESLSQMGGEASPKIVFAHIVAPHPPFVFGENGEPVEDVLPLAFDDGTSYVRRAGREAYVRRYRAQAIFVQHAILRSLASMRAAEKSPSIVILQSDHGSGLSADWSDPQRTNLEERLPNLNAVYFPPADTTLLSAPLTPVNTFRRILTYYFGADLPDLPDSSYFSGWWKPFEYIRWDRAN